MKINARVTSIFGAKSESKSESDTFYSLFWELTPKWNTTTIFHYIRMSQESHITRPNTTPWHHSYQPTRRLCTLTFVSLYLYTSYLVLLWSWFIVTSVLEFDILYSPHHFKLSFYFPRWKNILVKNYNRLSVTRYLNILKKWPIMVDNHLHLTLKQNVKKNFV